VSELELGREIRHNFGISVKPEALRTTLDELRARGFIRDIPGAGVIVECKTTKKDADLSERAVEERAIG